MTIAAGNTPFQYETPGSSNENNAMPAPAITGPTVIGIRGPIRCASAPMRAENSSIIAVSGSSDAPAAMGE